MAPLVLGGSTGKVSGTRWTQSGVDGSNTLQGLDRKGRLDQCPVSVSFEADV